MGDANACGRTREEEPPLPAEAVAALIRKLRRHSVLSSSDERIMRRLHPRVAGAARGTDIVRQGDRPDVSVFVLDGMLARHHTLPEGDRQYISLHIAGDLPDLQSLFLKVMDHSLMAIDDVQIALLAHQELTVLMRDAPDVGCALWRQSLIDAAIFREAVTNIGLRSGVERLAHMLCEQFVRAKDAEITEGNACNFPLTQLQIGQLLGMSLVSVNRALQTLRKERCVELRDGRLVVKDLKRLEARAAFDPGYLHLDLLDVAAKSRRRQSSG